MTTKSLQETFEDIYLNNTWASPETVSGGGSEKERTKEIRKLIPMIVEEYGIKNLLDAGCGDLNWFPIVKCHYDGCDIVPELVEIAKGTLLFEISKYRRNAFVLDITKDLFRAYDLIVCRTVLFHLSLANITKALENFRRSGSSFLLMTTHPHTQLNRDIEDGNWRRINFMIEPFNFPQPIDIWPDGPGNDGFVGLWNLR